MARRSSQFGGHGNARALKSLERGLFTQSLSGDAIIAATALVHGLRLVTRNVDDLKHIDGLEWINPFAEPAKS